MSNQLIEGKYTIQQCMDTAERVVKQKTSASLLLDVDAENRIPKFHMSELTTGHVLGKGGFCVVSEITKIALKKKNTGDESTSERLDDEHAIQNIVQDRAFMETHCLRGKDRDCRYALKILLPSCKDNAQTYINGVVDLAVEARFLSVIRHPSIIKMRAMAVTSPYSITDPFFVVLDRLYDILGTRINKWKRQRPSGVKKLLDRGGKKESAFWIERITVAYDLAAALQYLHELNVVYRDIKPDNIGFDVRGDVKIFDFGLAKELDPLLHDANGFYQMTGDTGSPRYMAPEVALGKPYNERVDVYSFAILLWQILKLETPYEGFTMHMLTRKVVEGGARPKCDASWPQSVVDMMHRCWGDPAHRPPMTEVVEILRSEMGEFAYILDSNILDASRKSDNSLRHGGDRLQQQLNRSANSLRAITVDAISAEFDKKSENEATA